MQTHLHTKSPLRLGLAGAVAAATIASLVAFTVPAHASSNPGFVLYSAQGYDHAADADAERMEVREAAILARLGYADPYAAELPSRGAR